MSKQSSSKMLKEIFEQPKVLAYTLAESEDELTASVQLFKAKQPRYVVVNARGTSSHAALYAKYLLEHYLHVPVAFGAPSLFTLYDTGADYSDALVITISQSGASEDLLALLEAAKRKGAAVLAVTNTSTSPLARAAEVTLLTRAGKERAVAATKTFTTQLLLLASLVSRLAGARKLQQALAAIPEAVESTLSLADEIAEKAERYRYMTHCAMLGRGYNLATAYEAALKLTECAYVVSQGFSLATFEHGPKALATQGFPLFLYAAKGAAYQQAYEAAGRYRAQGAEVFAIADCARLVQRAGLGVKLPVKVREELSPIPLIVVGQLLAYNIAVTKGHNPDAPRLLNKVTITR